MASRGMHRGGGWQKRAERATAWEQVTALGFRVNTIKTLGVLTSASTIKTLGVLTSASTIKTLGVLTSASAITPNPQDATLYPNPTPPGC